MKDGSGKFTGITGPLEISLSCTGKLIARVTSMLQHAAGQRMLGIFIAEMSCQYRTVWGIVTMQLLLISCTCLLISYPRPT